MSKTPKMTQRFQLLLTEEEFQLLKQESLKRGVSVSELIRKGIHCELTKKTSLQKIQSIRNFIKILNI